MEKMIKVINDNLRSVINGIKVHKADTEKTLAAIKAEMDSKILIANEYKVNVENSRMIISNLENEISGLEKDLSELNAKFGTKDFREILAAGNKEINTKIIEKRAAISEQSQRIAELTEKARLLKTNLIKLKDKKISTESTLNKDIILEQYYETRINEIIEYSEENPQGIRDFVEDIPQTELMTSFEDIDTSDIRSTIDGSVFEEIDNISSDKIEIDENFIKEVIVNGPTSLESDDNNEDGGIDLTMTQQLDDIILQANDLLEKSKKINGNAINLATASLPKAMPVVESPIEPKIEMPKIEETPIKQELEKQVKIDPEVPQAHKENINIFVPDDLEEIKIPEKNIVMPQATPTLTSHDELLGSKDEENIYNVLDDLKGDDILSSISSLNTDDDDDDDVLELKIENDELDSIVKNTDELTDELSKELDSNIITESSFDFSSKDITEELKECNLEASRFSDADLEMIKKNFNKNNTMDFINVMRKHNIAVARVYESANVLASVTPQNLDHILSILEDTGAISNSISYVFNLLDRVNINELEKLVQTRKDYELTELLYKVIPYNGEKNLADLIDLTPMEEGVLRKNTSSDEFKMMNLFSSIIAANYNELKKYDIRNINECVTKYPQRFTLNPDNFSAILDKYDPEDLVRCINKNCAVINKL